MRPFHGKTFSERSKSMTTRVHLLLVAGVCLLLSASAVAQTCPTSAPQLWSIVVTGTGNCSPAHGIPCGPGDPVVLEARDYYWRSDPYRIQACDTVTWNFGDGSPTQVVTGSSTITHTFSKAGEFYITATVKNAMGTSYASDYENIYRGYVSVFNTSVVESAGRVLVTISRTTNQTAMTVNYGTKDGSAVAGTHYQATSGTLSFGVGETNKQIEIPIIDNATAGGTSSFSVNLSAPTGGFLLNSPTATVTIQDNELPATFSMLNPPTKGVEGQPITITVARTGDMNTASTLGWYVSGTSDRGLLHFTPGQAQATFTFTPENNTFYSGTRQLRVEIFGPTNGAVLGSPSNVYIDISDDESAPTVSMADVTVMEGNAGKTDVSMTLTASQAAESGIRVYVSPNGGTAIVGSDYDWTSTEVVIPPGATSATFVIKVIADRTLEPNETLQLWLTPLTYYYEAPRRTATLTIVNDDVGVGPSPLRIQRGGTAEILVRTGTLNAPATVTTTIADTGVATARAVTLPAGGTGGSIPVHGVSVGRTTASVALPLELGGETKSVTVVVYEPADLVFDKPDVTVFAGGTERVGVRVHPAQPDDLTLAVVSTDPSLARVTPHVVVPAGGSGFIDVTGVKEGLTRLNVTLPSDFGGIAQGLLVTVKAMPVAPTITRVSPPTGASAGGTAVTLTGLNFRGDCVVLFGGMPAAARFVSATQMTATAPPHAVGPVDVALTCGADRFTFTNGFTYVPAPPEISRVTPNFGTADGGTLVRVAGSNLQSHCGVFFGDAAARRIELAGPDELWAVTPRGSAGTVNVTLRCGSDDTMLRAGFSYVAAADPTASILSVEPLHGVPGQTVTLTGTRLRPDDRVTFGDLPARIARTTPGSHEVVIPNLPLGRAGITITDAGGRVTTTGPIFNVLEPVPPQIATLTPSETSAGAEIVAEGQGFRAGYDVEIGSMRATIASLTFNRLVLRVPATLSTGRHPLTFMKENGVIAAIGPSLTIVEANPALAAASPACSPTDGGALVTLGGRGFSDGARVEFGGVVSSAVTVVDGETIRALAPANAIGTAQIVVTNADGTRATLTNAFAYHSPHDAEPPCAASRGRAARH